MASALSPGEQCILSPPQSQPLGFLGAQWEQHLSCALCLLWGADLWLRPSWHMSTFQDPRKICLATGSLLTVWWGMPVSGAKIARCLLALALTHLPLCHQQGEGLVHSWLALLWYSLSPLFFERTKLWLRAFPGKALSLSLSLSLFFFSSQAIPQFGLLSHVSSLSLPSRHSGLVLTLSMQPVPPCSAPACCWWT